MATAAFNPGSPAGMDPWQIESVIAPAAYGGSQAEAQNMLNMYQTQREAANNVYGQQVQAQNQFAQQQLHQQLYEANLKGLAEAKDPTVLQLMAGNPTYSGVLGDNSGNIIDALMRSQAAQQAKNFEAGGKGAEGYSNAGYMVDKESLPGLPANANVVQTENARLAQERIRAGAMVQAALIRASGAAGGSGMSTGYTGTDPDTGTPVTGHAGPKTSPAQVQQWQHKFNPASIDQAPPNPALPSSATNLPTAKTDTPANAPQNTKAGNSRLQQLVQANLSRQPAAAQADIRAAATKNNGVPIVGTDAQGPYALGANGQKYR